MSKKEKYLSLPKTSNNTIVFFKSSLTGVTSYTALMSSKSAKSFVKEANRESPEILHIDITLSDKELKQVEEAGNEEVLNKFNPFKP